MWGEEEEGGKPPWWLLQWLFTAVNQAAHQHGRPSDAVLTGFHLAVSELLFPPSFLSQWIGSCQIPDWSPRFQLCPPEIHPPHSLQRALFTVQMGAHHSLLKILQWLPVARGLETSFLDSEMIWPSYDLVPANFPSSLFRSLWLLISVPVSLQLHVPLTQIFLPFSFPGLVLIKNFSPPPL